MWGIENMTIGVLRHKSDRRLRADRQRNLVDSITTTSRQWDFKFNEPFQSVKRN
jgi:hypothetical protein